MATVAEIFFKTRDRLEQAELCYGHGFADCQDEAAFMLLHVLGVSLETELETMRDVILNQQQLDALESLLTERIKQRIPLAYLMGQAYFAGMCFMINKDVIIPRSPMADSIIARLDPWCSPSLKITNILDMCTGSGCIAAAAARAWPEAHIDAVDISASALSCAMSNIERLGLKQRINFFQGNLFAPLGQKQYQIIISNPPYVAKKIVDKLPPEYHHEPANALDGGVDGLELVENIILAAKNFLSDDGILFVEVGESRPVLEDKYVHAPFYWLDGQGEGLFILYGQDKASWPS